MAIPFILCLLFKMKRPRLHLIINSVRKSLVKHIGCILWIFWYKFFHDDLVENPLIITPCKIKKYVFKIYSHHRHNNLYLLPHHVPETVPTKRGLNIGPIIEIFPTQGHLEYRSHLRKLVKQNVIQCVASRLQGAHITSQFRFLFGFIRSRI